MNDKTDSSKKYVMGQFYEGSGLGWGEQKSAKENVSICDLTTCVDL